MLILIDDLLALSRVSTDELEFSRVNLAAIATDVVADLRAASPANEVAVWIRTPMYQTATTAC